MNAAQLAGYARDTLLVAELLQEQGPDAKMYYGQLSKLIGQWSGEGPYARYIEPLEKVLSVAIAIAEKAGNVALADIVKTRFIYRRRNGEDGTPYLQVRAELRATGYPTDAADAAEAQ